MKRVICNKGSHGIDGMTVYELRQFFKDNWIQIKESIINNEYKTIQIRRVEIPKTNGGTRLLEISTVSDSVLKEGRKMLYKKQKLTLMRVMDGF